MNDATSHPDPVLERFLRHQREEGMALAASSDLFELVELPLPPPTLVATFHCNGLVRLPGGAIEQANYFQVGVWFPPDYLRRADPFEILRWFGPANVWHPNISDALPLICVGRLSPGTPLVDILYQVFEIITYTKYTPREDNCLNKACCAWARENQDKFPVDKRPLKRRPLNLEVTPQ
jgi:hypothetical protein